MVSNSFNLTHKRRRFKYQQHIVKNFVISDIIKFF